MQFKPIPAAEALRPYIRNYWILHLHAQVAQAECRIMTNGAASMFFFPYKEGIIRWNGQQLCHLQQVFNGPTMHNFSVIFPEPGEYVVVGVEFHPAGVHAFFRDPTSSFVDQHIPGCQLGDDFVRFEQLFAAVQDPHDYTRIADRFFVNQLAEIGRTEEINMQRMMRAFAYVESHHPADIKVADLASEACISPRQFNRVFTEYAGLSPKEYLRIYRFHAALLSLREHPAHTTLMQLAWDNGYYDLRHMNTDFRDICTHAPKSEEIRMRLTETFGQDFSLLMKKKILPINVE